MIGVQVTERKVDNKSIVQDTTGSFESYSRYLPPFLRFLRPKGPPNIIFGRSLVVPPMDAPLSLLRPVQPNPPHPRKQPRLPTTPSLPGVLPPLRPRRPLRVPFFRVWTSWFPVFPRIIEILAAAGDIPKPSAGMVPRGGTTSALHPPHPTYPC